MASPTLAQIKEEITGDPVVRGYAVPLAKGNVLELARLLNEPYKTGAAPVSVKGILKKMLLAPEQTLGALRVILRHGKLPDGTAASFALMTMAATIETALTTGQFNDIDYQYTQVKGPVDQMLGALVGAGLMRQETGDDILAEATMPISRAQELWDRDAIVSVEQIAEAIRG